MRVAVNLKGNIKLADLYQAIADLRAAGCPWDAPVTTDANVGIDIEWSPPAAEAPNE